MARFEVFSGGGDTGLLLDCQSNTLSHLNTRFVVPLMPPGIAPIAGRKLNPHFTVDGRDYVMVTQFAGAVSVRSMGDMLVSLGDDDYRIIAALDMLLSGV